MIRNLAIIVLIFVLPGISAAAQSSAKSRIIRQWNLNHDFTEEVSIPFDTVFSLFHRYRITDRYSPLNATLGNYGLPFYQLNFFDRINDPDEFLYANYLPVMYVPRRALFMNTQVPFTELVWSNGGPRETSEQTLRVRHSQNVNRYLNFGLIYDIIYNLGQYNYQRAEDKNFTFFSSYTAPVYKFYFSAGINNITSYENGGISNKEDLRQYETRDVPVNLGGLNTAKSFLKNNNILLVQRFTVGRKTEPQDSVKIDQGFSGLKGTFSHVFIYENTKRSYADKYPQSGFYDSIYINKSSTFDSLAHRIIKNTLRFDFTTDEKRKFRIGGGAGIRNELIRYSQIIPTHDILLADTMALRKSNNAVVGRLFNDIGDKFRWSANGELFLTGYRAGDFSLSGEIIKSFGWNKGTANWSINGGIINRQPSLWYEQWGSNHFEWNNTMKKEFRIDIGTRFNYPDRNMDLRFNYAITDNYTDFNTEAVPSQHGGGLSVASLLARKDFRAWKFHIAADVLAQVSSNSEILDLPLVSVRSAGYIEHLFRFKQTNGALNTQLGADLLYHTPYYAYSWMPSTGRFFRQEKFKTGNYPFINVFLNLKLKRTRIFVMYDHVTSGLLGYDYFMIPSYPMNYRMLRYGIAWTFYN
ncbi:MAG TPA: hypothetical protein DDW27_05870 [Bacteroidales bacterium]|nr:hypothetical protein [Bacteroidales bacterium]